MRWIRFSTPNYPSPSFGVLEDATIFEIDGDIFGQHSRSGRKHSLADVKIEVPVVPRTFYCAGMNYSGHAKKYAQALGGPLSLPMQPDIGYRANNALIAHEERVIIPADTTGNIQYEGELVVVIGREARNLDQDAALSCVFGYTVGNDVSERGWQKTDATLWRAKNSDTFKPMGPWIETSVNLDELETRVSVNGMETTRFATNGMIFGIATYISRMTRYLTLYPGDVIWMGTDGSSPNLGSGDVVEIEISGIGTLRNTFVAASELEGSRRPVRG